jgi:tRNA pseudouridine13 synthase
LKLKQKPEDFTVSESWRFDAKPKGAFRVYAMDKQKVSTFEAIARIAKAFKLPKSAFSFCGLKDKQGRTRQLIAVEGAEVDLQEDDLRLKFLGRTDEPLSARNTTSNRFGVTVRDLSEAEVAQLPTAVAEVNRLGVVNYFDSQRFGSLKHGQGFIAKDLLRGDFEAALHNFFAKPSELDRTHDAHVKAFWRDHWGEWRRRCTIPGAERYDRIVRSLRERPQDFRRAFLQIDPKYRALQIFTYQSWLWNEGVRRFLVALLPGQSLIAIDYQAGKLLFPREAPKEVLQRLRRQTFPLVGPETKVEDPEVQRALGWVLGREKLSVDKLIVPDTPEVFFRHEERPVIVQPGKLMVGPSRPDELNRGAKKIYLAFTLPPGSYATLVVRRLLSFTAQSNLAHAFDEEETPSRAPSAKPEVMEIAAPREEEVVKTPPLGFRASQKLRKEEKAKARAAARPASKPRRK